MGLLVAASLVVAACGAGSDSVDPVVGVDGADSAGFAVGDVGSGGEPLADAAPGPATGDVDTGGADPGTRPGADTAGGPSADAGEPVAPPDTGGGTDPVPPGVRYVRVTTTASDSWVSWGEIEVFGAQPEANLALGQGAEATGAEPGGPASQAVDGDPATSWNAGDFAPASITIELAEPVEITQVRLLVKQSPAGPTVHELSFGDAAGEYQVAHTFDQHTETGQWLTWPAGDDPDPPVPGDLPRGLAWVKANPMFLSALCVSSGPPSGPQVSEYFGEFGANAAHLWSTGLPDELAGWESASQPDFRWVSWVDDLGASSTNGELMGGLQGGHPGRIGFQVGDEPGLQGDGMTELLEIENGVDAIRAADPDALIIVNFSYGVDGIGDMLAYFGGQMDADVFSYDRYTTSYSAHETLAQFRAAGLAWDKPYWRYLKSFAYVGSDEVPSESDLRWDAFSGLAYGYSGHTWFVYQAAAPHDVQSVLFQDQGGLDVSKTPLWATIAQINVELKHLGRTVRLLRSTDVRYVPGTPLYSPAGPAKWAPGAGGDPYITSLETVGEGLFDVHEVLVGYFDDDAGERYVFIQSQQHSGAGFPIANDDAINVRVEFDFTDAPAGLDPSQVRQLVKETGLVEPIALEDLGGDKRALQVTLAAGNPILFAYATQAPFVTGP